LVFGGTATSTTLGSGSDEIVFASGLDSGAVISSGGYLTVDSGGTAVSATVMSGGTLTVEFGGTALDTVQDGGVVDTIPCFAAGTLILTERGDVPVECLAVGDRIPTEDGATEPVIWIGARDVDCRRHPRPGQVQPVRIQAHAFGPNAPHRDLLLSPDHAIYAEGVLIPVKHLINGDTIRQIDTARVTYVHVELPRHVVILAEGLPCESYLDTGDRGGFVNADGPVTLHPAFGAERCDVSLIMEAAGYAPLRVTGPEVDKVRAVLCDARQPPAVVAQPG
jgi:autotransporter passenger strand-loop-strand repeat protein